MQSETKFRTVDGLMLSGTLAVPDSYSTPAVVLLHGNGETREESGLFENLAYSLELAGLPNLRFDMRGHGVSEGRQQDRTLSAHLNDIQSAISHIRRRTDVKDVCLVATSFSGGLAAWLAVMRPDEVTRLVLFNPQLDHKSRFIDQSEAWTDGYLNDQHVERLNQVGYLNHSYTTKTGRAFLHETFWIRARAVLANLAVPTLIVHGTEDRLVPVESSREAVSQIAKAHLVEIAGAGHRFAINDDEDFSSPATKKWQAEAIELAVTWAINGTFYRQNRE